MFQVVFQEKHYMIYSQGCGFEGGVQPADVLRFVWTVPLFETRSTWFGVNKWSTHGQHMLWNLQKINLHVFCFWQAPYIATWSSNIAIFRTSTINIIYPFIIIYIFCFHDFPIKKTCIFVMSSHKNDFFRRWFEMWSATETMPRWKSTFCRLDGGCQWVFPVDFPVKTNPLMDS